MKGVLFSSFSEKNLRKKHLCILFSLSKALDNSSKNLSINIKNIPNSSYQNYCLLTHTLLYYLKMMISILNAYEIKYSY